MSPTSSELIPSFTKLGESNHATWKLNMKALLMQKKVWAIVSGLDPRPATDNPNFRDWIKDQQSAAGIIFLGLEDDQKLSGVTQDEL
jgi:hypothetical protein